MTELYGPAFFAGRGENVMRSASVVVPVVVDLVAPRSVLDIGCGQGEWLEWCAAYDVGERFGVDIAAPDGDAFLQFDLCEPLNLARHYDLVISVEVGEHLPEEAADTYVDSIARHGDHVLFSAAVPGQEGVGHINCQPHEYWHRKFEAHGFETRDVIRPRIQNDERVSWWYRNNLFLYGR